MNDEWHTTPTGGNIFIDLGFDPIEAKKLKIKSDLMIQISQWIKENKLKQEDAAKVLKVSLPRISDVVRGKVGKFTIDTLIGMVELSGHQVDLRVS